MDERERDQVLARLDTRTKRVDEHIDRFEKVLDEHEKQLDDHESRIQTNENNIKDGKVIIGTIGSALLAGITGLAAKVAGLLPFLK